MERVDAELRTLAQELKEAGATVFIPESAKLIKFIVIHKDNKHLVTGFAEVPYHWYMHCKIKPSKELGSSQRIAESFDENGWDAEHLLEMMVKDYPGQPQTYNYLQQL
jgi:hypothetical protein